jgi:hypothetical protein
VDFLDNEKRDRDRGNAARRPAEGPLSRLSFDPAHGEGRF